MPKPPGSGFTANPLAGTAPAPPFRLATPEGVLRVSGMGFFAHMVTNVKIKSLLS